MKKYKVYKHPIGDIQAVKVGWSWPGFFLTSIWAMYKKMWALGLSVLFLTLIIYGTLWNGTSLFTVADVISLFISFVFGMNGNEWRVKNLVNRGYDYIERVNASSPDGAIAAHLKNEHVGSSERQPFV